MKRSLHLAHHLLPIGIPLTLIFLLVLLAQSAAFQAHPGELSTAITLDLAFTVPLVYFLLIRKRRIPKTTVVPFFVAGLVVASLVLPASEQGLLEGLKAWVVPVVEVGVLAYVGFKVRKAIRLYRRAKADSPDFFTVVKQVTADLMPKRLSLAFATEVGVFYYGFLSWRRRTLQTHEFSYHRKSGTLSVLGAFIFLILVETFVVHLLLDRWNPIAAWILSGLSMYTLIQLFGMARSLGKRPFSVERDRLVLRYGLLGETEIPLAELESVEKSSRNMKFEGEVQKLSPLKDFERHNVVLELRSEQTLTGLYGMKKKYRTLALHVDEPKDFVAAVEAARKEYLA